jgi:hypothetical protein
MIVFVIAGIGAILGALAARRRGGRAADMAQYAFGYAVAFGLLGLVGTILYARLAG